MQLASTITAKFKTAVGKEKITIDLKTELSTVYRKFYNLNKI